MEYLYIATAGFIRITGKPGPGLGVKIRHEKGGFDASDSTGGLVRL